MISRLLSLLRIVLVYLFFGFIALILMASVAREWHVGAQLLLVFVAPALVTWWLESRRARRKAGGAAPAKAQDDPSPTEAAQPRREQPAPAVRAQAFVAPAAHVAKASKVPPGWVPHGQSVTVAGRDIGGMIYYGKPQRRFGQGNDAVPKAQIDPSLEVAPVGNDPQGQFMSYWPSYSHIPPICRASYLNWLADGRCDTSYNPGYMFLYFYGLERRFFVDQPAQDEQRAILAEVQRLAAIYDWNGSARRYLGDFIDLIRIGLDQAVTAAPDLDQRRFELPPGLKFALGTKVGKGEALTWDWVLNWFNCHPEHQLRTPATRCPQEFRALFRQLFEARFPDGLTITKPRKTLALRYGAASGEFHCDVTPQADGKPVPDVSAIRKAVEIAQEIADEATDALTPFSRYLGRNPEGRGTLAGHALLPVSLRALFPSEELAQLQDWAAAAVAAGGLLPAPEVIARLQGEHPDKLTRRHLTGAADLLARLGFGLAPDPRFAMRLARIDEPLLLYPLDGPAGEITEPSDAYQAALLELALGALIVQADGHVAAPERSALADRIDAAAGLSAHERRVLRANMDWILAVPPDMSLLRRRLALADPDAAVALRGALVAAAQADGHARADEIAGMERTYKALGLDPALVYSDLHSGATLDQPPTIRRAQPATPGEPVPAEPPAALDAARISAIREDTHRASAILGAIFTGDAGADDDAEAPGTDAEDTDTLPGLDAASAALVREIAGHQHLTEAAFADMCARHGLMASGALETINEWAFGTYGDPLLDAYDGYDVTPAIAAAIRAESKQNANVQP